MIDISNYSQHSLLTFFKELNMTILKPWGCVKHEWLFMILLWEEKRTRRCNFSPLGIQLSSVAIQWKGSRSRRLFWYSLGVPTQLAPCSLVEVSVWTDSHLDGCSSASQLAVWSPIRTSPWGMFQWSRNPFVDCSSCPLSQLEDKLWSMYYSVPFVMK